eukprot:Gb_10193 [translate_table: standard]
MEQVLMVVEPSTFEELDQEKKWKMAMDEEMDSIRKNNTWDLVPLPKGKEAIGCRWVYKTKFWTNGIVDRHKDILVAKGYKQQEGIDYQETFSPVAKMITIRVIFALVAQCNWDIHQLDVKSTFLNGTLLEEVYMEQKSGFAKKVKEHFVCRLKKALYSLK